MSASPHIDVGYTEDAENRISEQSIVAIIETMMTSGWEAQGIKPCFTDFSAEDLQATHPPEGGYGRVPEHRQHLEHRVKHELRFREYKVNVSSLTSGTEKSHITVGHYRNIVAAAVKDVIDTEHRRHRGDWRIVAWRLVTQKQRREEQRTVRVPAKGKADGWSAFSGIDRPAETETITRPERGFMLQMVIAELSESPPIDHWRLLGKVGGGVMENYVEHRNIRTMPEHLKKDRARCIPLLESFYATAAPKPLSDDQRTSIETMAAGGMKFDAIASVLGLPESAVTRVLEAPVDAD